MEDLSLLGLMTDAESSQIESINCHINKQDVRLQLTFLDHTVPPINKNRQKDGLEWGFAYLVSIWLIGQLAGHHQGELVGSTMCGLCRYACVDFVSSAFADRPVKQACFSFWSTQCMPYRVLGFLFVCLFGPTTPRR
jgi:hypothetical protein